MNQRTLVAAALTLSSVAQARDLDLELREIALVGDVAAALALLEDGASALLFAAGDGPRWS